MKINTIAILDLKEYSLFKGCHLESIQKAFPEVKVILSHSIEDLMLKTSDADLIITWPFIDGKTKEFCKNASSLKWIHAITSGVEGIVKSGVCSSNVRLTSTKGIHGMPIADHVLAFIFSFLRVFPLLSKCQERKEWINRKNTNSDESFNKTVGIIGLGNIGMVIAKKCKALGMRVVAVKKNPVRNEWIDQCYSSKEVGKLLRESDFVVVVVPLTDETKNMLTEKELRMMKKEAYLINVARGGIVDEEALVRLLKENSIAGAGFDVFAEEPLPQHSPLWDCPNLFITPHLSAHSPYYMDRAVEVMIENITRFIKDQDLLYEVDIKQGY